MSPWYLAGCFSLAFLEGWQSTSFPDSASLCLGSIIWDPLAFSKRVASFSNTLS